LKIAIDASNIRCGGGLTHLYYFLLNIKPKRDSFNKVYIWANQETLNYLPDRYWLVKNNLAIFDKGYLVRAIWQLNFGRLASKMKCDLIFSPGGTSITSFQPTVVVSQNLLPFESLEIMKYGFSLQSLKWIMLRFAQKISFKRANGIIFLSDYAKTQVLKSVGTLIGKKSIIYHGIDKKFYCPPRIQIGINHYTAENPYKILYVSSIEPYKNQYEVIKAVHKLRVMGMPITLDIIGPFSNPRYSKKIKTTARNVDPNFDYIHLKGFVSHEALPSIYLTADLFIFASSCETFGQILVEAMASGLPIACSKSSAIPEIIGDAAVFFSPNDIENITDVIKKFILNPKIRKQKALKAYKRAKVFSWNNCALSTINFIRQFATKEKI
jgi:glycosyltransferase involved in cell wall biosynthesis